MKPPEMRQQGTYNSSIFEKIQLDPEDAADPEKMEEMRERMEKELGPLQEKMTKLREKESEFVDRTMTRLGLSAEIALRVTAVSKCTF